MLETFKREPGRIVIGLRKQGLLIGAIVLAVLVGGVVAFMVARGSFSLANVGTTVLVAIILLTVGVIRQFGRRHMILDLDERVFRLGKRDILFDQIEAVCLYTRIRIERTRSHDGHDRTRKYLEWHTVLVLGRMRDGGQSVGLVRRAMDKMFQLGARVYPQEDRDRAAQALAGRWIATDTETVPVSRGRNASFQWRLAEVVAGNAGVPLVDLSGDRISVRTPEELDTPLVERIRQGKVEVTAPGPVPDGIEQQEIGRLLQLAWNPGRRSPHRLRNLAGAVVVTVIAIGMAVWLAPLMPGPVQGVMRYGAIGVVVVLWAARLLRRAVLEVGPDEVVYRTRLLFSRTRRLPLGALEELRANPLLDPQLELVTDHLVVEVPLDREAAGWFRERLVAHLGDLAADGVCPPVPAEPPRESVRWLAWLGVGGVFAACGLVAYLVIPGAVDRPSPLPADLDRGDDLVPTATATGETVMDSADADGRPESRYRPRIVAAGASGDTPGTGDPEGAGPASSEPETPADHTGPDDTDQAGVDTQAAAGQGAAASAPGAAELEEATAGGRPPATQEPDEVASAEAGDVRDAEEQERVLLASRLHGRWKLGCEKISGARARRLRRRKRRRLAASVEGVLKLSPDGSFELRPRRRPGRNATRGTWAVAGDGAHLVLTSTARRKARELTYEIGAWSEDGFRLGLIRGGLQFELAATAVRAPWEKLGAYASVPASISLVEVELNRMRDTLQVRAKAVPANKDKASDRCRGIACKLTVRFYNAPTLERAFAARRPALTVTGKERFGRFETTFDYRRLCRGRPKFIGVSLAGQGEIGARVGGDRLVVEGGEGLCHGRSELTPPQEDERNW